MREFALPVVRVLVPLNPWSIAPYLAKQRERQARQALSLRPEQQLYCRFEKRHGKLECAFSAVGRDSANRPLLGETVRDWLATDAAENYLWCEALGEGLALTLVIGGHVAKDGVYAGAHVAQELKLTLSQLLRCDGPVGVYCGNSAARGQVDLVLRELEAEETMVRPAPDTLDVHLAGVGTAPELTRLSAIPDIRAWNRLWRTVRYGIYAVVLGVIGVTGYWAMEQFAREEAVAPATLPDRAKRNYMGLLATASAGRVLLDVHSAYRDFLGDRTFADYSSVTRMAWAGHRIGTMAATDAPSRLEVGANLVVTPDDWSHGRQARAFPEQLEGHAKDQGWASLTWSGNPTAVERSRGAGRSAVAAGAGFTVTRVVEATVDGRVQRTLANQRPPPRLEDGAIARTNGLEDVLENVGAVQVVGTRPLEVYETTEMQLRLENSDWENRGIVEWIASRLNAGPIVLDSVEMTTVDGGANEDATTIRFRLVWCVARESTCVEPLTAADFAAPQDTTPRT